MPMRLLILLFFFVLLACDNNYRSAELASSDKYNSYDEALEISEDMEIEPPRTYASAKIGDVNNGVSDEVNANLRGRDNNTKPEDIKIIRSGSMKFEVTDLEKTKAQIDTLLTSYKGYYENELFNAYGNRRNFHLRIRVPNAHFENLITNLEAGTGKLVSKDLSAQDVTTEYVDLNIRLENNLAYLEQYKAVLKKAKTIKEILEVKEKIRRIEEEIESKKGRLKYLDNKVSFSTLSLELTQLISRQLSNQPSFFKRIANAFKNGIAGFLNFVIGLINFWPFILLCLLLFLMRKRVSRWFRRKLKKETKPSEKQEIKD